MHFPTKVCICILRDGTKIYEDIASEEELEELCQTMEENKEFVRNYFAQYYP